ncbi:hypothetical protein [Nonomuraea lactucae]|uniref:hypothetical protein n=1 Tax=Nonomuraea lactucae TaxID=2249762 RepID=UPI0013B38EE2|nr:hypothetical protein [Nonomuraea lactucae]
MSVMQSSQHDGLVKTFIDRPQLAVEILRDLMGVDLPDTPLIHVTSMKEIMTSTDWPIQDPFFRHLHDRGLEAGLVEGEPKGRAEGKAEEAARSVLLVLAARGFDVPDDTRARITTCTDLTQLETWLTRAATAQTLQNLFNEPG